MKNLAAYYVINAPQITEAILRATKEADVVLHANILPSLIATKIARKYGKPTVYDYLDHYPESVSAYFHNTTAKYAVETAVRLMTTPPLRESKAVITPSHGLKAAISKYIPPQKIYAIPNGVDPQLFHPVPQENARKQLGLDPNDNILLRLQCQ